MAMEEKGVEDIDSLKEKLLAVSNEIDAIKSSFSKGAENLSRIQKMLNVDDLEDLGGMIEKFEIKIAEAEKQKREASDGARRYSEELEKEKERLIKLWDAYKDQEEELSTVEKKINDYEERARIAEASRKQLEDDLTARINTLTQKLNEYEGKASKFDEYRQKYDSFDKTRNQLERDVNDLRIENSSKEEVINNLSRELNQLKGKEDYTEFKEKYEKVSAEHEKEKERLTKLYQLYEEVDSECKRLKQENQSWQSWYNANKDIFSRLFSTAPPIGETETSYVSEHPEPPENPIDNPAKTKRKLRFRK